jgi:hypothetical protein
VRSRRRIVEAAAIAGVLSGAPSATCAVVAGGSLRSLVDYGINATRAAGTLIPPGRPGVVRGLIAHCVMSLLVGEALARLLPKRRSVIWGGVGGLCIGTFNLGVIGRRLPAIRALSLGPQLADHVAFGALFAAVVDRP